MEKVINMYDFKKQKLIEKIDSLLKKIDYLTSKPIEAHLNNPKPVLTTNVIPFKLKN